MSFASPIYLLALGLVPLVLGAYMLSRRRAHKYAVRFPAVGTLAPLLPKASTWRRRLPLALFLAYGAGSALFRSWMSEEVPTHSRTLPSSLSTGPPEFPRRTRARKLVIRRGTGPRPYASTPSMATS